MKKVQKYMTATEARKHFYAVIQTAKHPGVVLTITHEGLPEVVMMSVEEFEGWQETLEIMADPELAADVLEGIRDMKNGKKGDTIDLDTLKKRLKL